MSDATPGGDGRPTWFTSSYSNGAGGECVECAVTHGGALVRDSKGSGDLVIAVRSTAWRSFVRAVRQGTAG
ncbi:DUF397 domain-containing protein [Streptomyces phaeoluteigriseus]|uniref:DUF397 domain-containing protein n=1 Tax=Streptomyces phaeoluteigriseus TaxID=114686 RepID=A0ABY4ZHS5_9ACTN|nr:DUF397 domain-containing protein [Streptomyces phaeoluteigriseus]USQ88552.1 DUF397 domain-containing protein [Streptomyces phaeoluteigriseus]